MGCEASPQGAHSGDWSRATILERVRGRVFPVPTRIVNPRRDRLRGTMLRAATDMDTMARDGIGAITC